MAEQILQSLTRFLPETILIATICVAIVADLLFRKRPQIVAGLAFVGVLIAAYFTVRQLGTSDPAFS